MSGAARIHMQHFQVGRLAAPAAVTLTQLRGLGSQSALPVPALLFRNPALLLRALDALQRTDTFASATPLSARLGRMDHDWLESLVRRTALHQALQENSNHAFLLRHWYLTRRVVLTASALAPLCGYADAGSVAGCAALLRAGMLVLEQQQSAAYAVLTAGPWQQEQLLAAERELFQLDHVEAAVRLAEGWKLDQFTVDALRYQNQPLPQVLDAAPLVRICWYAAALAESTEPDVIRTARELLNLSAEQVHAVLAGVQQELDAECLVLGVNGLQRAPAGTPELVHEARQQLQLLRQEISTDNMLAQHAAGGSATALDAQLARVLQDAGIDPVFIVLARDTNGVLDVRASHRVQPEPAGLRIACVAGRNVLSTLVLGGEPGVWTDETPGLTVVDRQLLALLGGQTVLCEPLRDGNDSAVLLLGLPASAVTTYLAQHALRRFVAKTIFAAQQPVAGASAADTLLLQQRVREAVHEANNPLAIIKNYLYVLGMKQGEGKLPEEIQLIRAEIDRVAAILSNLREPKAAAAPRKISLNKVVTTMQRLFAQSFLTEGREITVALDLAPEEPQVLASEDALKQILVNLVKNAAEALSKGTITLETRSSIYLHDRFHAQLTVRDDGPGIAPEVMQRLFKPGASTKGGAHTGSGLGIEEARARERLRQPAQAAGAFRAAASLHDRKLAGHHLHRGQGRHLPLRQRSRRRPAQLSQG
jgi:signal transduction histidine kinase